MAKRILFLILLIVGVLGYCVSAAEKAETLSKDLRPFTLIVLPDTQVYARHYPEIFYKQTEWIKENAGKENIVFVSHVGDIVEDGSTQPQEWDVANKAMSTLNGVVPWAVAIGNHDYDAPNAVGKSAKDFLKRFGPERFSKYRWYGGSSPNGLSSYQFFSGGRKFIILHLESDATDNTILWAKEVLREHSDRSAIVSLHVYLIEGQRRNSPYFRNEGGNSPEDVWNKLIKKNPQIFMVLCGHVGAEWYQISTNDAGERVLELLTDYQHLANGGNGWLRIIRFVPEKDELQVKTYSPTLDTFKSGLLCDFTLPFSFTTLEFKEAAPAAKAVSE